MGKQRKVWVPAAIGAAGTIAFVSGIVVSLQANRNQQQPLAFLAAPRSLGSAADQVGQPSPVTQVLQTKSVTQRVETLKQVAKTAQPSLDRNRARYLLATDLLEQGQAKAALEQLNQLDADYPVMVAPVLQKRAEAYKAAGQADQAQATWQELLKRNPQDPAAAEALYALGQTDPKYWDQAIAQFPGHPRTIALVKQKLKQNPQQLPLLLLLAKHDLEGKGYVDRLNHLVKTFGAQLQPQDWQAIGFGYWEHQEYDKAAEAYARSPQTPQTAYRAARGLHVAGKPGSQQRYQQVVQRFPGTPEAGLALKRLAQISEPTVALAYLDQLVAQYPDRKPEALLEKATLLDQQDSQTSASQTRQYLLDKYPDSDAAAQLRWRVAQQQAKAGDLKTAKQWAQATLVSSPTSEIGAQAGFWAGKWALQLGDSRQAGTILQKVIREHPESYYAWRSATLLGWNVGDFHNLRDLKPAVKQPSSRSALPAGSDTLKELHQLGQDGEAWAYWQVEFQDRQEPTVAEQFTDGVMRLGVGDHLDGLFMVSNLADRDKPADRQQYLALRTQPEYWQALYPFPYMDQIETWSQQRSLNPMLVTALIRQESRFEPQIKSVVGATGLMQVMPETAAFIAQQLQVKGYNLENPEDNIKLGTWYLDHTHEEYSNNSMLAVASYNAGPGAVAGWLAKSKTQDADTFVENIPYDETRDYVKSVFANYWNYLRLYNPEIARQVAQVSPEQPPAPGA